VERGIESVTTRQIAARVGISQTALYLYFSTKEQVLDSLVAEVWRGLAEALDATDREGAARLKPAARLRAVLAAFMLYWLHRPDDFRIVFMRRALRNCPSAADDTTRPCRTLLRRLAERAKQASDAGELQYPCSLEEAALAMWAAVSAPVALRVAYPELPWPPEDKHVETTLDMLSNACIRRQDAGAGEADAAGAPAGAPQPLR
jgi:AcrR family transcriptional regulator